MPKRFRPFAILARCWLHEELRLSSSVVAEPLNAPLSFQQEVDLVASLAAQLGITPASDFHAKARDRLEGVEPTALLRFEAVDAADFDGAVAAIEAPLELACSVLAFYTTNSVIPIAVIIVESDDTFRARFMPTVEPAMIHVDGYTALTPRVFAQAEGDPQLALALSLLRTGQQASREEFRIFHYVQSLEVLSSTTPGGSLDVRLRRFLPTIGITPAPTTVDRSRDFAHVLAELRNVVAHGNALTPSTVQPFAAPYASEPQLERRVRDFTRDVIARAADPSHAMSAVP
jgi:hypothetical protein